MKNRANRTERFVTVNIEANIVGIDKDWWVLTGAIKYISYDCSCLKTYNEVEEMQSFYMGNSSTAKIIGRSIVDIRLTSGEIPSLTIVLHVLEIH